MPYYGPSSGVTDGDKGDITVSGSGSTWTVDNGLDATKIADGTVTSTEFQYINTLSSNAQTQIDGKQPLDSDLTAIAGLGGTGVMVKTGAGSVAVRTLTSGTGITVSNGTGVSGDPTFAINSSVATISGAQNITDKSFQDSTTLFYNNTDSTKKFQFTASAITTATTRTYTMPNANTALLGNNNTDTITNKTIDADSNTITNIENADIKALAGISLSKLAATTASRALVSDVSGFISSATTTATEIGYVNGVTSSIQTQLDAKAPLNSPTFTGTIVFPSTNWATTTVKGIASFGASQFTVTSGVVGINTVVVSDGGTGRSSNTTYALLAGGTTVTSALQQVTKSASTTAVLTSTGTSSLPTFQELPFAVQSDQETSTSTTTIVSPGVQHFHPSAAKFWGVASVSAAVPTLNASYNITSITDTNTGLLTVTIATDLSSVNYTIVATVEKAGTGLGVAAARIVVVRSATQAAGTFDLDCHDSTATTNLVKDPGKWHFAGYGDI